MAKRQPKAASRGTIHIAADKAAAEWKALGTRWGEVEVHKHLSTVMKYFEGEGLVKLRDITANDLATWQQHLLNTGHSAKNIDHKWSVLRTIYRHGGEDLMPRPIKIAREEPWTLYPDDLAALVEHLRAEGHVELALLVTWTALTGMSLEESRALRLKDLDEEGRMVIRNGKPIPIHPVATQAAMTAVKLNQVDDDDDRIYPTDINPLEHTWQWFAKPFLKIAYTRKAGLSTVRNTANLMRTVSGLKTRRVMRLLAGSGTTIRYFPIAPYDAILDEDTVWKSTFAKLKRTLKKIEAKAQDDA